MAYGGSPQRVRLGVCLWPALRRRSGAVAGAAGPSGDDPLRYRCVGCLARQMALDVYNPGKRHTQHMERTLLTLRTRRTRLVRTTSGFSTSVEMQAIVSGVCVERYACGWSV
jgi:hypothetical protein